MKVVVTLECRHADGFSDHRDRSGGRVFVGNDTVILDGLEVVKRDRRPRREREPGHPWLDVDGATWTGFTVRVES
jgi:hypothetical protein